MQYASRVLWLTLCRVVTSSSCSVCREMSVFLCAPAAEWDASIVKAAIRYTGQPASGCVCVCVGGVMVAGLLNDETSVRHTALFSWAGDCPGGGPLHSCPSALPVAFPSVRPSFLLPFHTSPYRLPFLLDPILTNLISSTTQSVFFKRHATLEQPAVRFHVESFTESRWRVRVARGGDPSPACCSQAFKGTFFQGYLPDVVMSPAALFNGQLGGRSSFN